jgi:hypothetical protein
LEARKRQRRGCGQERPAACLAIVVPINELTYVYLLAITSQAPTADQKALEIPEMEMRRVGLKPYKRGWIVLSESNRDILERSYYLDPNIEPLGVFSDAFPLKLQRAALPFFKSANARVVRR